MTATAELHREVAQIMGMPISLALRGRHVSTERARRAWDAVTAELREIDSVFSTYRADSPVSRLRRREITIDDCPPEVAEVLAIGRAAQLSSDGAFSIDLPGPDGRRRLDPTGVVKGWAVERAARFLDRLEETDYCLSAGGDMTCRTVDPDRPPWRIGVEDPHDPTTLLAVVPLRTGAIATSGTAHRGSHLMDARTGRAPYGVASVTVIAGSLTTADVEATAAYAHGPSAADWLRARSRRGLVVWADRTSTVLTGGQPEMNLARSSRICTSSS